MDSFRIDIEVIEEGVKYRHEISDPDPPGSRFGRSLADCASHVRGRLLADLAEAVNYVSEDTDRMSHDDEEQCLADVLFKAAEDYLKYWKRHDKERDASR